MSSGFPVGSSQLSIAVVGAGAIGSTFAYYLARAGHTVTVVARPDSLRWKQLARDSGIVHTTGDRADTQVADQLDEQAAYDLVIVTTLAHQVDALLPQLQRSRASAIQFMFNTFEPERLRSAVGESRSSFGMPFVMSTLDEEGRLRATVSPRRKTLHGDERWAAVFTGAGIASAFERDMALWLRCHTPLCVAMESIAFRGKKRGSGASWTEAATVARGLHGGFEIVRGLGYTLYPGGKRLLYGMPEFLVAGMLWSVSRSKPFRELLATGAGECRALIDVLTRTALGVEAISPLAVEAVIAMKPAD